MAQNQRKKIYVNYFIQNDKWETIKEPNLFVLPGDYQNLNDIKAKVVYDNFPYKDMINYYLRFYLDDKEQNMYNN